MRNDQIHTKAERMAGISFSKNEESARGMVRVQIRDRSWGLQVRKWNYVRRSWGKWAAI